MNIIQCEIITSFYLFPVNPKLSETYDNYSNRVTTNTSNTINTICKYFMSYQKFYQNI